MLPGASPGVAELLSTTVGGADSIGEPVTIIWPIMNECGRQA